MVLVTVNIKSETVSPISILEACYLAQKMGERGVFHIHLSPLNAVELFYMMLVTVNNKHNKSETVSSLYYIYMQVLCPNTLVVNLASCVGCISTHQQTSKCFVMSS